MIDVSQAVKTAYETGGADTSLSLTIGNTTYSSGNILAGSFYLVESMCSSEQFALSSVEKNELGFTLFNITENISDLQDKQVVAKQTITVNGTSTDIPLGTFTITEAVNEGSYLIRCVAFDTAGLKMDKIIDDWWNTTVQFPISVRNLVIALFTHLGISYDIPATFTNSAFVIPQRNAYLQGCSASELVGYLQEVTCSFFKPGRDGVVRMYGTMQDGLYPSTTLHPAANLHPKKSINTFSNEDTYGDQEYRYGQIVSGIEIADFTTHTIDRVQVRGTQNDVGIIVGTGTNTYVIQGNLILYGLSDEQGRPVVEAIYERLNGFVYVPFSGKFMAMPFLEVGDMADVVTYKGLSVRSPIFKRTLNGSKIAFDTLETNGTQYYEEIDQENRIITVLAQKTHELVYSVDGLISTVTSVESEVTELGTTVTEHSSQIAQNAEDITLKVSTSDYTGNEIISKINLNSTTAKIEASKIVITGYVTFNNLKNSGETEINGGNITTGNIVVGGNVAGTNQNGLIQVKNSSGTVICQMSKNGIEIKNGTITSPSISSASISGSTITGGTIESGTMYWYKGTNNEASIKGATTPYSSIANGVVMKSKAFQIGVSNSFIVNDGSGSNPWLLLNSSSAILRGTVSNSLTLNSSNGAILSGTKVALSATNGTLTMSSSGNMSISASGGLTISGSGGVNISKGSTRAITDGGTSYLDYNDSGGRQSIVAATKNSVYMYAYNNGSQYGGIEATASGGLYVYTQIHGGWYSKRRVEWRAITAYDGSVIYALCEA